MTEKKAEPGDLRKPKLPDQKKEAQARQSWVARHSAAVSAWSAVAAAGATIVLAAFAYVSWQEVRAQRQQIYDQMRLATEPILLIRSPKNFTVAEDSINTEWTTTNKGGGPVEDVNVSFILLDTKKPVEELSKSDPVDHIVWNRRHPAIAPGDDGSQFLGVSRDAWGWVRDSLEDTSRIRLYALATVRYKTRPRLLGGEPKTHIVTASFWWNRFFSKWMNTSTEWHDRIKATLLDRGIAGPEFLEE